MSALPPKADMDQQGCDIRFVPKADILRCSDERRYSITSSVAQAWVHLVLRGCIRIFAGQGYKIVSVSGCYIATAIDLVDGLPAV